jgi:toxin FitB
MNVVDSSAWLEYLADGPNAENFAAPLLDTPSLIVPAITIYEVFKIVCHQRGEDLGLQAVALMQRGQMIELGAALALEAARLGLELKLPLADSIILATAQQCKAVIWTQDEHFRGLPDVRYFSKR